MKLDKEKFVEKEVEVFCLLNVNSNSQMITETNLADSEYFAGEYVCIAKGTVLLKPVVEDPIPLIVETLEKAIQKERADSVLRVEAIQERINSVLALENKSGEES